MLPRHSGLDRRAAAGFPIANELDVGFLCIPEVLAEVGYRSARLGKWHLGPDTQGFGLSSADGRGGPEGSHYGDPDVAEQLTTRAIEFIGANRERPFFLYLSHWDVHAPHRARAGVVRRYADKLARLPPEKPAARYALEADPAEQRDRAAEEPDLTAALRAELDAWQKATNAPVPTVPNPECTLAPQ